jgi:membrane associated rhomboid family serine protease
MDRRKFGTYIFLGLICGAALGAGLGQIWWGALVGAFVGWFMAAAVEQRSREKEAGQDSQETEHKP